MLQSSVLSALAGIRHGFFTRAGGVSTGCYESLKMAQKVGSKIVQWAHYLGLAVPNAVKHFTNWFSGCECAEFTRLFIHTLHFGRLLVQDRCFWD